MLISTGDETRFLSEDEIRTVVQQSLDTLAVDGKKVLILIPDGTRSMPMPLAFSLFDKLLAPRTAALDYMVALGTHQPMTDSQLSALIGRPVVEGMWGRRRVFNHEWSDPGVFVPLGNIPRAEIEQISGGLLAQDVAVRLNKHIFDYDQLIICGPVFPHEVVGFSGGNKYLFPGIAGPEIINFTHWLGAVITSYAVIGSGYTPVRAVIDRAAAMIDRPVACFSWVVQHEGVSGLFFGGAQESWQAAADLSAKTHIRYVDKPFQKVLSIMPAMYDDLWTAAKGMYKLEPAVADGGEVIIYAPHIDEVSYTHGKLIDEVGYHCRDFFLKQWEHYSRYPGGVLAHSTHLTGMGAYDAERCTETPRIRVKLATGIPEERCKKINLGYLDPASVHMEEWLNREDEGILVVTQAGEILYRVRQKAEKPTDDHNLLRSKA
ncbi:MAG: lactate racemase domain-containing protein [Anaerolineaceae bacterium]